MARRLMPGAVLLLALPWSLAWLAARLVLPLERWSARPAAPLAAQALPQLVLVGPLLETLQLMLAAALVGRLLSPCRPVGGQGVLHCTGIVAVAFIASHVALRGMGALASLPMALMLSAGAVCAVRQGRAVLQAKCGVILFAAHAWYNAALLALGDA
ncbi:hypothetical protein [Massilia eburnea]|uniref:hypothetical protein n=1 Tax=Massilia eburnea TaxID=1776165 RepID=UPI003D6AF3F1